MEYVLPLQESNAPQRHVTTLHMMLAFLLFGISFTCIALNIFRSVYPALQRIAGLPFLQFGGFTLAMSVALIWLTVRAKDWMGRKRNNLMIRLGELSLMLIAAILFYIAGWRVPALLFCVMAAVLIFAIINERRSVEKPVVVFDEQRIAIDGAKRKTMAWSRIEKIILRHHILTISLRDNSIIQRDLGIHCEVEPAAFEAWCATQIAAHAGKAAAETW